MSGGAAAALLAVALLVEPGPAAARTRLRRLVPGAPAQRPGRSRSWRRRRGAATASAGSSLRHAAGWDLLAACLRAGMPVPAAIRAVATGLDRPAAAALSRTAELMALGADPVAAWDPALACPKTAELARSARRAAHSGTALAAVATRLASDTRTAAADSAEAGAQRAAVLITLPLGLCFLPAFVCLGVVPVVIGLAGALLSRW